MAMLKKKLDFSAPFDEKKLLPKKKSLLVLSCRAQPLLQGAGLW